MTPTAEARPMLAVVVVGGGGAPFIVVLDESGETVFDGPLADFERAHRQTWRERLAAWLVRRGESR